jgi:diguanylate cyclase (GGDEF)-like protein
MTPRVTPASPRPDVSPLLRPGGIVAAYQPVVRLRDDEVVGYEALARMTATPERGPDAWLRMAEEHGIRAELEVACLHAAVLHGLPPDDQLLFVNLSPSLLGDERVVAALEPVAHRLVLEVSEHVQVADYDVLARHLADWQDRGTLVAVDDTGSGYASLRHVLRLAPNFIKLDKSLVDGVDHDRSLRALVVSFVAFARESGASVVAEGVETRDQLAALRDAGVHLAQGYLLGRPGEGWLSPVRRARSLRLEHCATVAEVGEAVCEHLEALGVMPSLYVERDGLLRCVAQRGLWQVLDGLSPGAGITGQAYGSNTLLVVEDVATAQHYLEAIPGVVAEACTPIRVDDRAVGALNIDSTRPLQPADVDELRRCGELVGERLATLHVDRDSGPLARLVAATIRLERATTEADIADVLLDAASEITDMSTAVLVRPHDDGRPPTAVVRGPLRAAILGIDVLELAALVEYVSASRSCYSAGDDGAVGMVGTDGLRQAGIRSVVVVPIRPATNEPGLLAVASTRRKQLHTDTIELLELLATQAAARLETLAHIAALRRQATEDPLTGLGNRAAFNEALDAWQRLRIVGAVAVFDVDDFKRVNDTFGHLEGDSMLSRLADAFRTVVRPGDGVFRLGGDEFAVLLPEATAHEARSVGDRIQLAASTVLESRGAGISVGVATVGVDRSVEEAMRDADRHLYEAKRARAEFTALQHPRH